ncbi:MAG: formylglycine-generating enzyme family protein [Cyanobacteria bacterium REEB444]|nr:formylglycine-generating enzyme family protein [Cyanobacteria bacterium REEB444]
MRRRQLFYLGLGAITGMGIPTVTRSQRQFLGLPVEPYQFTTATVSSGRRASVITPKTVNAKVGIYRETGLKLGSGDVPLEMVGIPGGTFRMGNTPEERGKIIKARGQEHYDKYYSDEEPSHVVRVPDFFMGRYEVTQAHYEAVMGTNPAYFKGNNRPVENVSWDDSQEFIRRLNQITGKRYRLPTEAEWEYAARAGTTSVFSYGDTISTQVANYWTGSNVPKEVYRWVTVAVNTLYPNPWGLYHIHGNVWEWVEDYYHGNYEGAPTDGSAWLTGGNQNGRVLRGGSWHNISTNCRSACRSRYNPDGRDGDFGFRVVLSFP